MGFWRRFRTYLIGFGIGCLLVFMFFGDRTSLLTAWMPNNRVLLRLQLTEALYTEAALCQLECLALDTADVRALKEDGDVQFNLSETHTEPKIYLVEMRIDDRLVRMSFIAYDSTSTLSEVVWPLGEKECGC